MEVWLVGNSVFWLFRILFRFCDERVVRTPSGSHGPRYATLIAFDCIASLVFVEGRETRTVVPFSEERSSR